MNSKSKKVFRQRDSQTDSQTLYLPLYCTTIETVFQFYTLLFSEGVNYNNFFQLLLTMNKAK
jgi:hypothetical protein